MVSGSLPNSLCLSLDLSIRVSLWRFPWLKLCPVFSSCLSLCFSVSVYLPYSLSPSVCVCLCVPMASPPTLSRTIICLALVAPFPSCRCPYRHRQFMLFRGACGGEMSMNGVPLSSNVKRCVSMQTTYITPKAQTTPMSTSLYSCRQPFIIHDRAKNPLVKGPRA
jgi:hypothetical protein